MRLFALVAVVVALVGMAAGEGGDDGGRRLDDGVHWKQFKSKFNKVYSDPAEDYMRMGLFMKQRRRVEQHNAQLAPKRLGFTAGLNHMSDWTDQEKASLNGFKLDGKHLNSGTDQPEFIKKMLAVDVSDLPSEVDWRKVPGRVGEVKDQGVCGASWAFSTTGVVEGQQYRFNNNSHQLIPLSEQNLMDCSHSGHNRACGGGNMWIGLGDIAREGGIESDKDYPFVNMFDKERHKCVFNGKKSVMTVKGEYHTINGTEESLQKLLAQFGPISVGMMATDNLLIYRSGVLDDPFCEKWIGNLNHAVLVVGYGTDRRLGDYWIVKNSWGAGFGEDGYFRIVRNQGDKCMISLCQVIPTF